MRQLPESASAEQEGEHRLTLRRYLARLIWICVGPMALLAGGLAVLQVLDLNREREQQARDMAHSLMGAVDQSLQSRLNGLSLLALQPLPLPLRPDPVSYQAGQDFVHAFGSHVLLADPEQRILFNTRLPLGPLDQPLHSLPRLPRPKGLAAAVLAQERGRPAVGDLFIGPVVHVPLVALAAPVLRAGQVRALWITTLEAGEFSAQLQAVTLPAGWRLSLRDSQGGLIAGRGLMDRASDGKQPALAGRYEVHSVASGWTVLVEIPATAAQAPLIDAAAALAVTILVATLAAAWGGSLAGRRLGLELSELTADRPVSGPPRIAEMAAVHQILEAEARRRTEVESTLQASERRFRSLFEQAPLPLGQLALDGKVIAVNHRFTALFGYSQEDIPTLSAWWHVAYPDAAYRAEVAADWAVKMSRVTGIGGNVGTGEYRVTTRDGTERLCVISGIQNEQGLLVAFFDLSEREQAQQTLRDSQAAALEDQRRARLAALNLMEDAQVARARAEAMSAQLFELTQAVEQNPQSIVITDLKARVEYVNEAFVRNSGYRRDEILGQDMALVRSGKTAPEVYRDMWSTLTEGRTWKGEFINRRKNGSELVELAVISPLRMANGEYSRYVEVLEDVTEKKRLAQELERYRNHLEELVASRTRELEAARAQADTANRAKSSFLANMSHEIRTPLNAVLGLTYLLRQDAPTPTQRQRLDKVDAAAQHLLAIISDILDLSKIEAGHLQLEEADFDLPAVVASVQNLVASQAQAKGLRLNVEIAPDLQGMRGDPTRLRQALLNLAGNAVKFTEQGEVWLRVYRLAPDGRMGDLLRFEVQDTGIGVSPERLGELFQPFSQADASTTRRFGGTGLGLTITRRLAHLMGGEAGAESEPGVGSRFWFTARLTRSESSGPALVDSPPRQDAATQLRLRHGGARVLVVEDNPVSSEVAQALLRQVGLQVDTADNGRRAVQLIEQAPPSLVLMDMQLPDMDGVSATRAVRRQPHLAKLPILAMTANAFAEDRQACLDAGMNDFLTKPVNPENLYAVLLRWLDSPMTSGVAFSSAPPEAAPVVPGAGVMDELVSLLGPEVLRTWKIFAAQPARYVRLLHDFADGQERGLRNLREALAAADRLQAQHLAHDLKGAAATLGATELSGRARALEAALKAHESGDECERLLTSCEQGLAVVASAIRRMPASPI